MSHEPAQSRRFGSVVRVRAERWEEYRKLHEAVWPELLELFRQYGVRNFTIYHYEHLLFSYKEYAGEDYERDMDRLAQEPLMRRWLELTDPCQLPLSPSSSSLWADMQEIFHMDGREKGD
ncbi:L-rhamnose mutarotase [Cohnella cellulosilytica]|uniref:L-rhamnose mutarotase n=1 Tax=Cohnella cellulosilytica TaxID=986710 RepID=A0ABW2F654_9BACL